VSTLISPSSEASRWIEERHSDLSGLQAFGRLVSAVIWTDNPIRIGEEKISLDPKALVAEINDGGMPLLHNHDPGRPVGRVLVAREFISEDGTAFIAAILGYYNGGECLSFKDVGIDLEMRGFQPRTLPPLDHRHWIACRFDPREFDPAWISAVLDDAPLPVRRTAASHNAAETIVQLLMIGLPYAALVWNPLVNSMASEAGKDLYPAIKIWMVRLLRKCDELTSPIVDVVSHHRDCQVSFLLRGKNAELHEAAYDVLPSAAATAASIVNKLCDRGTPARRLVYEFDPEKRTWHPSFAELEDQSVILNRLELVAIEKLPKGLSIGVGVRESPPKKWLGS
jgi:hypothetical protein